MKRYLIALFLSIFVFSTLYAKGENMQISSPAFKNGGEIPVKYGCRGEDISIPLMFLNIPENAKSLALIMEDPDAPGGLFVHWVIYNIPASFGGLPEGILNDSELEYGIEQGVNDFGKIGYGGPCPPDRPHRYFIKLYALDTILNVPSGLNREELLNAMKGHIISTAQLMGIYER